MKIISYPIEGGIQDGTTIKLKGTPNAGAKRFTINLQKGPSDDADIAFHFDVRLDFDPNDKSVVVCNHRVNNGWGGEERTASHFPFKPSSSFEIEIIRKKESYIVTVDGHDLMNFKQRPNAVHPDWLTVTGDLHVDSCKVKSK